MRMLLVEDEDDHALLFQNALESILIEKDLEIVRANSLSNAFSYLVDDAYDIVVLDLGLPESKGLPTLVSFFEKAPAMPVIVLTSSIDMKLGEQAIHLGAQDYITKDYAQPAALEKSIRYSLERYNYISELSLKQKALTSSLEEKEALLKEIHHRVKNNMQVISSLLKLQERSVEDMEIKNKFRETRERVLAMSLVHERLYQVSSFSKIDLDVYVNGLVRQIYQAYQTEDKSVQLQLELGKEISLSIDKAVPFGLIINELVTNALKYAFSDGFDPASKEKILRISLQEEESDFYQLIVEDNGRGLPSDFKLEELTSMGLELVVVLVKQLGGDLQHVTSGEGVRFCVKFEA